MLVHELIAVLLKEDPNKEVRIERERFCGMGGCDCTAGTYDYDPLDVDTEAHEFVTLL